MIVRFGLEMQRASRMDKYTTSYSELPGDFFVHIEVRDYELCFSIETKMILFEEKWAGFRKAEIARGKGDEDSLYHSMREAKESLEDSLSNNMTERVSEDRIQQELEKLDWSEVKEPLPEKEDKK